MPHKVLAVDDNVDTILILSAVLEKEGYHVITARDGLEAIEKVQSDLPALILLDLMMPKMNGFDVCRAIKGNPKTSHIPILMLTAKTDPSSRKQGLALGANEYLTKPLNPKEILTKIREHLPPTEPPAPPGGMPLSSLFGIVALFWESIRMGRLS
jgi:two-component system alkaline phosphatase synthesis response regulator PhoP